MNFKKYIDRINQKLDECLIGHGDLTQSMRYSVIFCGKRFRPILTYIVADTFATSINVCDSSACAVELIHAYSLIHDDLPSMDNDDIRHDKPACHKKFSEAQAVLTGDGLHTLAFKILTNDKSIAPVIRIKLLQELTYASLEMALGQAIDISIVAKTVDIKVLTDMYQKKTGALLKCAIKLGAILSPKCTNKDIKILDSFAKNVGLAYQIQDDVLEATEDVLGKKQNSDKVKNKPTYFSLLGKFKSQKIYKQLYNKAEDELQQLSVNTDKLKELTKQLKIRKF